MSELSGTESTIVKQASDDLKRLSVMFSGVLKIAPVLDRVVSLQQAAVESEGRVTVARDQEAALKESIADMKIQLVALTERISAANARADGGEKEAADAVESYVNSMLAKAAAKAEGITAEASRNASSVIDRANVQAKEMMDRINALVAAKNDELAAVSSALDTTKAALASAQKSFEELREKVK